MGADKCPSQFSVFLHELASLISRLAESDGGIHEYTFNFTKESKTVMNAVIEVIYQKYVSPRAEKRTVTNYSSALTVNLFK